MKKKNACIFKQTQTNLPGREKAKKSLDTVPLFFQQLHNQVNMKIRALLVILQWQDEELSALFWPDLPRVDCLLETTTYLSVHILNLNSLDIKDIGQDSF